MGNTRGDVQAAGICSFTTKFDVTDASVGSNLVNIVLLTGITSDRTAAGTGPVIEVMVDNTHRG